MSRKLAFLFLLSALLSCAAQSSAPAGSSTDGKTKSDYPQESFVIEKLSSVYRFEKDGTGVRRTTGRSRVQSEAAVQQLGQLVFGYNSANERLKVNYVRVRKADGTVVTAAESAMQDMTSPVARDAPFYSDLREKHVTVPALRPGEVLEYEIEVTDFQPLAPGHFWMDHTFEKNAISLDESLEVDVPENCTVHLKTQPGYQPRVSVEAGRKLYRWNWQHLAREEKKAKKEPKPQTQADVAMTTFGSWDEVAEWYSGLEKDRRVVTPELAAKVKELTAGATTDRERAEAIYDYVAKNFRYVSLSFGVGRYQPHAAAEIFANQYGDCKDKHTLLAAMMSVAGIRTDTVLIHSSRKLDTELPSPSQFDHVISAIWLNNARVFLDTTAEIAPFGALWSPLRHKKAILVTQNGKAEVIETPADLPFPSLQKIDVDGKITELGRLERRIKYTTRGDVEVAFRSIFRRVPQANWKEVLESLVVLDGMRGEVKDIKMSDVSNTHQPFELEFTLMTPNFVNFSSKKSSFSVPVPTLTLPSPDEDETEPVQLGATGQIELLLHLAIPEKFKLTLPVPVTMKRDYAGFQSGYSLEKGVLTARRELTTSVTEIPMSRASDLAAFATVVQRDSRQAVGVEIDEVATATAPKDAEIDEVDEAARAAFDARNYQQAITLYQRVVELNPKHKFAWNNLGRAYLNAGHLDEAENAFKKQIEINPYDLYSYNNLGLTYQRREKWDEAKAAFLKQIEVNPLDRYAHRNLGRMLVGRHDYEGAIPELEKAISIGGDDVFLEQQLGDAYLKTGKVEKALDSFDKLLKRSPSPTMWNNVAYALAESGTALDRAQQYAESAVSLTGASLDNLPAERLMDVGAGLTSALVTYWDTLGWVYFRQGKLDEAEKYIKAAWELGQVGEVGDHLAQVYEKRGKKSEAILAYSEAIAATGGVPETRNRLAAALGNPQKVDAFVDKMRPILGQERTLKLSVPAETEGSAEFKVLLRGSKVEQVTFDKGKSDLRKLEAALRSAQYPYPEVGTNTRIFRKVIVDCSKLLKKCTAVMMPTGAAALTETPVNEEQLLQVTTLPSN